MPGRAGIGSRGFWRGPLTYLARMTADDTAILQRWSTDGLNDEQRHRIEATVNLLLYQQGHAAAATWAVAVRPKAYLDAAVLGDQLVAALGVQPRLDPLQGRGQVGTALEPLTIRTTDGRRADCPSYPR
jgi:hypothetical protein